MYAPTINQQQIATATVTLSTRHRVTKCQNTAVPFLREPEGHSLKLVLSGGWATHAQCTQHMGAVVLAPQNISKIKHKGTKYIQNRFIVFQIGKKKSGWNSGPKKTLQEPPLFKKWCCLMRTEWSWQDPKAASLTCLTLSWVRQHDNEKSDETMCRKLAGPAMHVSFFTIYLCEFTTPIHPLGMLQLAKCNQSYIQPWPKWWHQERGTGAGMSNKKLRVGVSSFKSLESSE